MQKVSAVCLWPFLNAVIDKLTREMLCLICSSQDRRNGSKDMKTKGSLGWNDYKTTTFKLLKKISKKSGRIINNGLKLLYWWELMFNYLGDCLAGFHCKQPWKVEAQQFYLISKGTFLYAFRHAESKASIAEGQQI